MSISPLYILSAGSDLFLSKGFQL